MEQARDRTYVAQQYKTTSFYELHKWIQKNIKYYVLEAYRLTDYMPNFKILIQNKLQQANQLNIMY